VQETFVGLWFWGWESNSCRGKCSALSITRGYHPTIFNSCILRRPRWVAD